MAVKIDLYDSLRTVGVLSYRRDRAIRRGRVTGLSNTTAKLDDAIAEAIAEAGYEHHVDPDLPLVAVTARAYGTDRAYVWLEYRKGRWYPGGGTPFTTQVHLRTTFRNAHIYCNTFDKDTPNTNDQFTNGLPGDPTDSDTWIFPSTMSNENEPTPRLYSVSQLELYVKTLLDYNPVASVVSVHNKTNDAAKTWGGYEFTAGTIRFDGCSVSYSLGNNADQYLVQYKFTFDAAGFQEQQLYPNGEVWGMKQASIHQQATFPTFPVAT